VVIECYFARADLVRSPSVKQRVQSRATGVDLGVVEGMTAYCSCPYEPPPVDRAAHVALGESSSRLSGCC